MTPEEFKAVVESSDAEYDIIKNDDDLIVNTVVLGVK